MDTAGFSRRTPLKALSAPVPNGLNFEGRSCGYAPVLVHNSHNAH